MNKKFKNKYVTKNIEKAIKLTLEDKRFFSYDIDYGHSYYMAGFSYHAFSIF